MKRRLGDIPSVQSAGQSSDVAAAAAQQSSVARMQAQAPDRLLPITSPTRPEAEAATDIAGVLAMHTQLMQADTSGGAPTGAGAVLKYLLSVRKLEARTLTLYAVGYVQRRFLGDPPAGDVDIMTQNRRTYAAHDCVTFPWMTLRPGAVCGAPDATGDRHVCGRVKVRSITDKSKQALLPRGGGWGLFGAHTVPDDAKHVVVTEGEYDAMSVWQDTGMPAVSLPNGCRSLPVELLPWFERFEKIYLWMDDDVPGREGAERISAKLGLGRCHLVRPVTSQLVLKQPNPHAEPPKTCPKDANEMLQRGFDLLPVLQSAAVQPHDQIASFSDLRNAVMREVAASLGVGNDDMGASLTQRRPPAGTPIRCLPRFQKLLKGHRPGEVTILTGPTGSGKTTLLSQLTLDLAQQGVRTLWGSFEIKNTRLIAGMLHQLRGIVAKTSPGGGDGLPDGDGDSDANMQLRHLEAAADIMSSLPLFFLRFYGSTDVDRVVDALEYAYYVHDIEHAVLDNLQFMMSTSTSSRGFDKFDAQDKALDKFRAFATKRDVHVTLVIHPRKEPEDAPLSMSSVFGSAKATQEADTVVILQRGMDGRKYIDVKKNRYDGTVGTVPVTFDVPSKCFQEEDGVGGSTAQLLAAPFRPAQQRVSTHGVHVRAAGGTPRAGFSGGPARRFSSASGGTIPVDALPFGLSPFGDASLRPAFQGVHHVNEQSHATPPSTSSRFRSTWRGRNRLSAGPAFTPMSAETRTRVVQDINAALTRIRASTKTA